MKIPKSLLGIHQNRQKGFALVITLSLMILLTVIAVGLLSLSTISLRTSGHSSAMSEARANAKLALMLAIGDLQKYAGPDQRITATADASPNNPQNAKLTGVWQSHTIDANNPTIPTATDYSDQTRNSKFQGWLASSRAGTGIRRASQEVNFPATIPTGNDAVDLWGQGTLGPAALAQPGARITATKVTLRESNGRFAYAVTDEGVKARINTPYGQAQAGRFGQIAQLGSGQRPNTSGMPGLGNLDRQKYGWGSPSYATIRKGITHDTHLLAAEQVASGTPVALKNLYHDVTTTATSVLSDVASGGLKQDFNLLANTNTLPNELRGQGVYQSMLGLRNQPSDPRWESLHDLSRLYRDTARIRSASGAPRLVSSAPSNWVAAAGSNLLDGTIGIPQTAPPPGPVLMPTIAKVDVMFSLVARDIYRSTGAHTSLPKAQEEAQGLQLHNPWNLNFAGSPYDYILHLVYTPIVTLHNPYNVELEFENMSIIFGNLPFALQVFRNDQPQTRGLVPLDTMFHEASEQGTVNKRFGLRLMTDTATRNRVFRLLPGEVRMFSPFIDPTRTWQIERSGGPRLFHDFDSGSNRTLYIDGVPGHRGDGVGFDLDWFCPAYDGNKIITREEGFDPVITGNMNRGGIIPAKLGDRFRVEFAPISVRGISQNKFQVQMSAFRAGNSTENPTGLIEFNYETELGLQNALLGPGGRLVAPDPSTGQTTWTTQELLELQNTPLRSYSKLRTFAQVTAYAKTTSGGLFGDDLDGKFFAKPWAFSHAPMSVSMNNLVRDHNSWGSHEFNMVRLNGNTTNLIQTNPRGNSQFISGFKTFTGMSYGTMYDIPLSPLQSLTSLNSANPGGASGFQPRFAHPIGNSWSHPLMNPAEVIGTGSSGAMLDHSYLLNRALYDRFYFSGFGARTGPFGNNTAPSSLVREFIAGSPLTDPRLKVNTPDGKASETMETLLTQPNFYREVASWQMLDGGFNINSTSVSAWKAMLASGHETSSLINELRAATNSAVLTNQAAPNYTNNETRISRFRLPNSQTVANGGNTELAPWLAARNYSDQQLEELANQIVLQVKARGPFLSLSDFVNRKIGTGNDAQVGALQQAIDNTSINNLNTNYIRGAVNINANNIATYNYRNPQAAQGSSAQGAPGFLTQADVMSVLGNAATARSDTFTIRGYGEARNKSGNIIARAHCEAVMQRIPDYLDATDAAHIAFRDLQSQTNRDFGRKFVMVSFRWLSEREI